MQNRGLHLRVGRFRIDRGWTVAYRKRQSRARLAAARNSQSLAGGRAARAKAAAGFRKDMPAAFIEDAVAILAGIVIVMVLR